jgi:hypothetical protein
MHRFLIVSAFVMSTALIAPVAAQQGDDKAHQQNQKNYYDKQGKDTHTWNANEDKAYGVYQDQQRRSHTDFDKAKPAQQQAYFKWRHQNPDSVIFKVEVK